jgi:DNA-binding NarL/FixJ family response regulator
MIADDHAVVRQRVRTLVEGDGRVRVVGAARNGQEAVEMAARLRPHVIVMDISMPLMNGLEATRRIMALRPATRIIILSSHHDQEYAHRAKELGAVGFVPKHMFAEKLTATVREAVVGHLLCGPLTAAGPLPDTGRPRDRQGAGACRRERLGSRESELLQLVGEGSPRRKMALKLRISMSSVERRLQALMAKLGLTGLGGLADYAVASGFTGNSVVLKIT